MSLLAVGTLAYDTIETIAAKRADLLGGSVTYFSLAAALFGKVAVVGVVGKDFREADLALLGRRGSTPPGSRSRTARRSAGRAATRPTGTRGTRSRRT
jgi:hypothetical protein